MKRWYRAIERKWRADAAHAFLLHLNVADDFLNDLNPREVTVQRMREFLIDATVVGRSKFTAFFNLAQGITFATREQEEEFLEFLAKLYPAESHTGSGNAAVLRFQLSRFDVDYMLELFTEMLEISSEGYGRVMKSGKKGLREADAKAPDTPLFNVVLDFVETMTPDDASSGNDRDRKVYVAFREWAKNRNIRKARNLVVLTAESLSHIAAELRTQTSGISLLKIQLPDSADRQALIDHLAGAHPLAEKSVSLAELARLTSGMSLVSIGNLIKEAYEKETALTPDYVFETKKQFIEEQSGGLLEVMRPLWGVSAIGGLEGHKKYIFKIVEVMKRGDYLAVPMGILLMGAPGTGKTVFAEAVAFEAGIPFIKMKNIRDQYVGMSERRLDLALEIIVALAPVVVFEDEIDGEYQRRETMADNTGVNNRIQKRMLEIKSDTRLRGRVIWCAATNVPSRLDAAMLRAGRYDAKIPFFPPNARERGLIVMALLEKMRIKADEADVPFSHQITHEIAERFGHLCHVHFDEEEGFTQCSLDRHPLGKEDKNEREYTGGQIERILSVAYEFACDDGKPLAEAHLMAALEDDIPPEDFFEYGEMTDEALLYCNSKRFIPEGKWRERAKTLRARRRGKKRNDPTVL